MMHFTQRISIPCMFGFVTIQMTVGDTCMVWHLQASSPNKNSREKEQKSLVWLASPYRLRISPHFHVFMMESPSYCAGGKRGQVSGELHESQDTATSWQPTKAFFSPVVCRHPKAASKTCHAQTSCAHHPTLGQAEVSANSHQSQSWLPALTQWIGHGYMGKLQVGETATFCSRTDG